MWAGQQKRFSSRGSSSRSKQEPFEELVTVTEITSARKEASALPIEEQPGLVEPELCEPELSLGSPSDPDLIEPDLGKPDLGEPG